MTMEKERSSIRRILVALDASPHSIAALEAAAELASATNAELSGLFVEDINLLRVVELPFAREIRFFPPTLGRPLELEQLERQFRAQAAQMRQVMASIAQRQQVTWSFRVVRGSVAAEVLSAGAEADLVILGRIGRSLAGARGLGSTVRTVVLHRSGMTLIFRQGERLSVPVLVLYDGSDASKKALDAAAGLVKAKDGHLSVFILSGDRETARELQEEVIERLKELRLGADFRLLINPSLEGLAELIQRETGGPVAIPCGIGEFQGEALCHLVREMPNPVLLVR